MSEGRALTNCIGNGVATIVVAGWQGERDDRRSQEVLRNPSLVDEETEAAPRGQQPPDEEEPRDGRRRFERDREASDLIVPPRR